MPNRRRRVALHKAHLTTRTVADTKPRDRRYIVWDDELTGFGVRISASGLRSFIVQFIGACHRARLRRLDSERAIKATAHQLARLIYAMLTRGEEYEDKGMAQFETERRERHLRHLQRQARHFNLALVSAEQAA